MSDIISGLYKWKANNKLSKKQTLCFAEAYRRTWNFHNGDYSNDMLLLEYPSAVKTLKKYFKPYSVETPKVLNWYSLTPEGIELLKTLENYLPWDSSLNEKLFNL